MFDHVSLAPPDPILGLTREFLEDPRADKVNLGVGVYRDEFLNTPILACVKEAEKILWKKEVSKEYLPIEGLAQWIDATGELVFGSFLSKRCCGFQTPGGTAGLRVGGDFLKQQGYDRVAISDPSWSNHAGIFTALGWHIESYPYYDFQNHQLSFDLMMNGLKKLPKKTVLVLHASCHNPTGVDLSIEQWKQVARLCKEKELLPFFDCAYQGFGQGLEEDVEAIRLFCANSMNMLVAVSQCKSFSVYGERVGGLFVVTDSEEMATRIASRVKQSIRTHYSNPPMHGAKLVAAVLSTPSLRMLWEEELSQMRGRIIEMRHCLVDALGSRFGHLSSGRGMFGFTGLNAVHVDQLKRQFGIYMTRDGRLNLCGLNSKNLPRVVEAMLEVVRHA